MPPSLRPLWPDRLGDEMSPADIDEARTLLEVAVPDPVERVRALYKWFGAGKGPWSGYPSYEDAAEQLLLATARRDCSAGSAKKIGSAVPTHSGSACWTQLHGTASETTTIGPVRVRPS